MLQPFIDRFMARKDELHAQFKATPPESYDAILTAVINILHSDADYDNGPDVERITCIDYGHYQGTLVYVIAEAGYQPSRYWYTRVYYGSCSGCDTLQRILSDIEYDYDKNTQTCSDKTADDFVTLALHMLQNMHEMYPTD